MENSNTDPMESEEMTKMVFHNPDIRLGFHIGKEKTLVKSFERMLDTPLRSYQIYVGSSRAYARPPKPDSTDLRRTRHLLEMNGKYACVHGCLLYNLAGSKDFREDPSFQSKLDRTCVGLQAELDLAAGFGGGVVCHIGSCKDRKRGIYTIARSIEKVLEGQTQNTKVLSKELQVPLDEFKRSRKLILENAAGEGTKIGSTLDEIAEIIASVKEEVRDQVRVCIDTAHIFGAGQYDFGDPDVVRSFESEFDDKIGLDRLELFHLNDSRVPYGSRQDRHENLGVGYIFGTERAPNQGEGLVGLRKLIDFSERRRIPLIGEPPANTKDKGPGPGGVWDYNVIKCLCNLEEETFVCDS